ncbi:hypothetical protein [Meridianimarinicoccus roseus]|uniref:hypothetical protein n=1 Tax=Meridianimarinicoccus roseus TaxID=2072018 RepID=UPI001EE64BE6|nr:hypothetical protein [Meridianimarinicoccus roseus]
MLFSILFIGGMIAFVLLFPALLGKGWRIDRFGLGGGTGNNCDGGGDGGGGD